MVLILLHPWSEPSARLLESFVDSLGNVVAAVENQESLEVSGNDGYMAGNMAVPLGNLLGRKS